MAERTWEVSKVCYCEHVKQEVSLEAEVLHPADFLPDPPRVLAHRCSLARQCNLFNQPESQPLPYRHPARIHSRHRRK